MYNQRIKTDSAVKRKVGQIFLSSLTVILTIKHFIQFLH